MFRVPETSACWLHSCITLHVWTTFQTFLESEPAGPLLSGNIHEWSNKSVIQAGRTAVCSYMRRRVEVGNSPDWEDVDVAMTNSIQGVAQTHFKAVQCMFFLNAQTA